MKAKAKKKLCWNCEGNVSKEALNCPYCGVYLHPTSNSSEDRDDNEKESEQAPLPSKSAKKGNKEAPHQPLYTPSDDSSDEPEQTSTRPTPLEAKVKAEIPNTTGSHHLNNITLSLLCLLAGSLLLLFGIILFLFSHNGTFTLRWNGDMWYLYLLTALPLLFLGWQALQKVKDE